MRRSYVGKLATGQLVFDRPRSHIHGNILPLIVEGLSRIEMRVSFLEIEIDFERIIGDTICVEVGPGDNVRLERRPGRKWDTRFVYGRKPEPTSCMTFVLKTDEMSPGDVVLITAYVGNFIGPEPGDPMSTPESKKRWASRALIGDGK